MHRNVLISFSTFAIIVFATGTLAQAGHYGPPPGYNPNPPVVRDHRNVVRDHRGSTDGSVKVRNNPPQCFSNCPKNPIHRGNNFPGTKPDVRDHRPGADREMCGAHPC
jgi:hypothetical protein